MALRFVSLPKPEPVVPGEGLKIEVVAPVEPRPRPGSIMEVGELIDGFRYVPPRPADRAPAYDVAWAEDDFPPLEPARRAPVVRRYESSGTGSTPGAESEPRRERGGRWFGFDNPLPDYAAERRARRARLEALDVERRNGFDDRRRYRSDPAVERPIEEPTDGPYGPEVG